MDKLALINVISRYCPGDLPDRFKHFGHYRGGVDEETEWDIGMLSEASEDDLKNGAKKIHLDFHALNRYC